MASVRKQRAVGRPKSKSRAGSPDARQALLEAARELLKESQTPRLARLEVAKRAGVDPALIRYYFNDMQGLLTELATTIAKENVKAGAEIAARQIPARDRLAARNAMFLKMLRENPHQLSIFVQAVNEARPHVASQMVEGFKGLELLVRDGVRRNEFREIDARHLFIAVTGMCEFVYTARPILSELYPELESLDDVVESYTAFIIDLIMNGIGRAAAGAAHPKTP